MKTFCSLSIAALAFLTSPITAIANDDITVFDNLSPETQKDFIKCGVDEDEFYRLMALDYRAFDQDFTGGWRLIDDQEDCKQTAINMLDSYTARHEYEYKQQRSTLIWHTGQVLASTGQYEDAIHYFKQTYNTEANHAEWNLYVDGTIAFLNKDKPRLIMLRDKLAVMPVSEKLKAARRKFLKDNPNVTMPDDFVDAHQNLSVMNDFITCFDKPYNIDYGKCK